MDSNLYGALCPDCQKLASVAGEAPSKDGNVDESPKTFNEADARGLERMEKTKKED